MSAWFDCADETQRAEGLAAATTAVLNGELVVLPTDTVYGVGADAFSPVAVTRLLTAKGRGREMPPPVLVGTVRAAMALVEDLGEDGQALINEFWPGGLTLVCRAARTLNWDLGDTKGTVALRMPEDAVALDLLRETGPMAVSSANLTGLPSATTAQLARDQLGDAVSVFLDGGTQNYRSISAALSGPVSSSGVALRAAASLRSFDGTGTNLANPGDNLGGYRKEAVSLAASFADSGWDVLASARFNGDYLEQPAASSLTAADYNCGSRNPQSGEWTYYCGDAPRTDRYVASRGPPDRARSPTASSILCRTNSSRKRVPSGLRIRFSVTTSVFSSEAPSAYPEFHNVVTSRMKPNVRARASSRRKVSGLTSSASSWHPISG